MNNDNVEGFHKFRQLMICFACLLIMANYIYEYHFSLMRMPAFIMIFIFLISLHFFQNSWFYHISGLLTGIVVFIPIIIALLTHNHNYIAFVFDGIISLFFLGYYGIKVYGRFTKKC